MEIHCKQCDSLLAPWLQDPGLALVCWSMHLHKVAIGAGFPIASPDGLYHDTGRNILNTQVASLSLSQDDPFCLWVSYPDVDPTSDVAAWVHTAAVDHVSAGRMSILDKRWKFTFGRYNIKDELESTSDPLATEGDDLSFA